VAWIDGTYVQNAIGSAQGYALGLLTTSTGTTTTARFTQYELLARGRVLSAMQSAGYPLPAATLTGASDDVTDAFLRDMTAGIMFSTAYGMLPGIEISDATQAAINAGPRMCAAVRDQKLQIPGLQPTAADAIDGSQFNTDPQYTAPPTQPVFTTLRRSSF
jgi:hypothetical protein